MRNMKHVFILLACGVSLSATVHAAPLVADTTPATIGSSTPLELMHNLKTHPLALLAKFPEAGNAMARYVAETIRKDPSVLDAILSVVRDTSPEQASAIGAGLVRGIRAMGSAQPATSRSMAEKIAKSDNPWLKTTFGAIGPRTLHGGKAMGDLPPTPPPAGGGAGAAEVGTALPEDRSRIGPEKQELLLYNAPSREDSEFILGLLPTDGMVVATLLSDAGHNGAVSTSPTR